jgi:hypothetical protein
MHASPREASRMAQAASAAEACWLQPSRAIAPATARSRVSVRDARRGRGGWTWLGAGGLEARAAAAGRVVLGERGHPRADDLFVRLPCGTGVRPPAHAGYGLAPGACHEQMPRAARVWRRIRGGGRGAGHGRDGGRRAGVAVDQAVAALVARPGRVQRLRPASALSPRAARPSPGIALSRAVCTV